MAVLLVLALPTGSALGQGGSPFQGLPQGTPETPTQATTQINSTKSDDGISDFQALLIAIAGAALLTGVVIVILRDAKKRAPIEAGDSEAAHKPADAHKSSQQAKRKQRQKDKAARAQRRRNR